MNDSMTRRLADLPVAEPDPERVRRVQTRCHAVLAAHRRRRSAPRGRLVGYWKPAVACLGAVYLSEVVRQALRFYRIL